MAVKVVHVSDLSGKEADGHELGKLVVHAHPGFADLPVTLEAFAEEIEQLQGASRFVTIEWIAPGARGGERLTVSLDDFNQLTGGDGMDAVVQQAIIAKHETSVPQQQGGARRRGRAARVDGGGRSGGPKVNYASLEHAGEPHRGRITETEKALVRDHLDAVNQRLRRAGKREIDPTDPELRERYGLAG
jgi:hypothetical protein